MNNKKITFSIPWWYWVAFIDFFLLFITIMIRHGVDFPQAWRLYPAFDLAIEMNLAVWWHGVMLMAISLFCYDFYLNKRKGVSRPWLSLSVVFFILAIDEICSIHERLPSIFLYGVFMPSIMVLAVYPLTVFLKDLKSHKTGLFILFGFGLYGSVFGQELLEHAVQFPQWFLGIRVAIEEGSELLGTFIILFGILASRESVAEVSFRVIIPKPLLDSSFLALLWIGIFAQIVVCLFVLPELDDLDHRGNPGIFYPTIINFILFCFLFWKAKVLQGSNRKIGFVLSCLFLFSSMGCMYNLLPLIPKASIFIPEGFLIDGFHFLYLGLIVSVIIYLKISGKAMTIVDLLFGALLGCIFALSFLYESLIHTCLLLGLFSFFIGYFFYRQEAKV